MIRLILVTTIFFSLLEILSINVLILQICNFSEFDGNINNLVQPEISASSGVIFIDGNQGWEDFKEAGNCVGNGNQSDPYIIRDLEISGSGTGIYCIYIRNSDVFFVIENCTLHDATYGIRLINVNNAHLKNNTCYNNNNGISMTSSNNSTISNCTLLNNQNTGIGVQGINITIENNSVTNSFWGISVTMSISCKIFGNKMVKCGLFRFHFQ